MQQKVPSESSLKKNFGAGTKYLSLKNDYSKNV